MRYLFVHFVLSCSLLFNAAGLTKLHATTYYFDNAGSDQGDGSRLHPFKTIQKLNTLALLPGDTVLLASGQTFHGTILLEHVQQATAEAPFVIATDGRRAASIASGDSAGIVIRDRAHVSLKNINLRGSGRKQGNVTSGLVLFGCGDINVVSIVVAGYQKAGVLIRNCVHVLLDSITAHDNGAAGIEVTAAESKVLNRYITIMHCAAVNNPGDPTNLTSHSGNGILVGHCSNVVIKYCTATNNGWDMPRKGNGPVGIWAYEADSVVIERCIAYRNKTSKGGQDGGGFDLDGGVTNSVIQYCLSYENQGAGFGIFQYDGATPWYNNTVRFNISINDGWISPAHAGMYIWNGSDRASNLSRLYFYNNVIVNKGGAAINYNEASAHEQFVYANNILVGQKALIYGVYSHAQDRFYGNDWWSLAKGFLIGSYSSLKSWASQTGAEQVDQQLVGKNVRPEFGRGFYVLTQPAQLERFVKYRPLNYGPFEKGGINLQRVLGITGDTPDFLQRHAGQRGIGALL